MDESAPHPSKQENAAKLYKNVYGLADASVTWLNHLKKALIDYGFKQSDVNPFLFYKGQVMFILYVHDGIGFSPNKRDANGLIDSLKKKGYTWTDEGPLAAYLGIQVEKLSGNRISLSPPTYIERVMQQCALKDDTPADKILNRDENGQARVKDFHYRRTRMFISLGVLYNLGVYHADVDCQRDVSRKITHHAAFWRAE